MYEDYIPEFVRPFMDKMEDVGYGDFQRLSKDYQQAVNDYKTRIYPTQQRNLHMGNKTFGENKKNDLNAALNSIKAEYLEKAKIIASDHGFVYVDNEVREATDERHKAEKEQLTKRQTQEVHASDKGLTEEMKARFTAEHAGLTNNHYIEKKRQEGTYIDRASHAQSDKIVHEQMADNFKERTIDTDRLEVERQQRLKKLQALNALDITKSPNTGFTY